MGAQFRLVHGKYVQRVYGALPKMEWDGSQKVEVYPTVQYGAQVQVIDRETKQPKMIHTSRHGDIVESDEPLDKLHPNKFARIEDNPSHLPGGLTQQQRVEELKRRLAEEEAKLNIQPQVQELEDLKKLVQQKENTLMEKLGPRQPIPQPQQVNPVPVPIPFPDASQVSEGPDNNPVKNQATVVAPTRVPGQADTPPVQQEPSKHSAPPKHRVRAPDKPMDRMTLVELQGYAAEEEIDLAGCKDVNEVRRRCKQALSTS